MDTRIHGRLTKKLNRLTRTALSTNGVVDPATVRIKKSRGSFQMPDCSSCRDRCCVHKKRGEGILLSLRDIAALTDNGLGEFIVGRYTFKKKHGTVLPEIDNMPRLRKKNGNCIFYEETSGLCTQYGLRPIICRRFPYEIEFKPTKSREVTIARFIPGLPCPKIATDEQEASVRQMVADAIEDENISSQDDQLLPTHHEELRTLGFAPYLPDPEDCPSKA